MLHPHGTPGNGQSRRDFLKAGAVGAGALALGLPRLDAGRSAKDLNCIVLFLVGGPSQLETFDPKPNATENIRGPFGTIRTSVPGVHLSEHLPKTAKFAHEFAIVRSVHHTSAPIHETGQQLMQTGRLARHGHDYPNYGSVLSYLNGAQPSAQPFAVIPFPIQNTGVSIGHGQSAGYLGTRHEPATIPAMTRYSRAMESFDIGAEDPRLRERYGQTGFGQSCRLARRLVENGVRFVTVNMFDTVFNKVTWDCHADGGSLSATLSDYRDNLCPTFDAAYSTLLEDLHQRGLLDTTLVVAMGEFGRTPQLNPRGGRDHWPGCWSMLFAGAGIRGGQVVGASDARAAEPKDRPVTPAEIAATIYSALGLDPATRIPGPDGGSLPLADAAPIRELK